MAKGRRHRRSRRRTARSRLVVGLAVCTLLFVAAALLLARGPFRGEARDPSRRDAGAHSARDALPLRLAAAPGFRAELVGGELEPVRSYLEETLDVPVLLTPSPTVDDALGVLLRSEVSAAILPAVGCLQAREWASGVRFLALQSYEESFGIDALLVARAGDGGGSVDDLRGRSICYVDRGSTAGYLAARSWLRSHGVEPDEHLGVQRMSGGELRALEDLHAERCDVAAVSEAAMGAAPVVGLDPRDFRAVATTAHVPGTCWVGAPRLDEGEARRLRLALHGFASSDDRGARLVGRVLRISRFRAADASSFRALRVTARLEGLLNRPETEAVPPPPPSDRASDAGAVLEPTDAEAPDAALEPPRDT